jgi:hypothetical protein
VLWFDGTPHLSVLIRSSKRLRGEHRIGRGFGPMSAKAGVVLEAKQPVQKLSTCLAHRDQVAGQRARNQD